MDTSHGSVRGLPMHRDACHLTYTLEVKIAKLFLIHIIIVQDKVQILFAIKVDTTKGCV